MWKERQDAQEIAPSGARAGPGGPDMTLWSDFLRRLMLGATLSAPAAGAAADQAPSADPPAEIAEPRASGSARPQADSRA